MTIASDPAALAGYRRALAKNGVPVTVTRITGFAPNTVPFKANVLAIVRNYVPNSTAVAEEGSSVSKPGAITIGQRMVILLADDLQAKGFPLPLQKNDLITLKSGDPLNVDAVDALKRAAAGAIELKASGVA